MEGPRFPVTVRVADGLPRPRGKTRLIVLGRDPALGFVEIAALAHGCRFTDCRHLVEPGCAIKHAVDAGGISARRYASYVALRERQNQ